MNNYPQITIITVCYNAEKDIEKTILSVINQTYDNIEYIVIDGGSNDGTLSVINKYASKIDKVISEPDKGIYDAMNKGIKLAKGDWINFMNAGDSYVDADVLKLVSDNINNNCDIIYGDIIIEEEFAYYYVKAKPIEMLNTEMPFCHQTVFTKTKVIKKYLFDLNYKILADYNQIREIYFARYNFLYITKAIVNYDGYNGLSATAWDKILIERNIINGSSFIKVRIGLIYIRLKSIFKIILRKFFPSIYKYFNLRKFTKDPYFSLISIK